MASVLAPPHTVRPGRRPAALRLVCRIAGTIVAAGIALGCRPQPPPPSTVTIRVLDEAKQAVDGAEIASEADVVARTNAEGLAEVTLTGREGAAFQLEIRCPKGYRSPQAPIVIRRIAGSEAPEYITHCAKLRHKLTVAIKTVGAGGNLAIRHLGKEIARTDETGSANVLIEGEVQERVELLLDTSDPKYAKYHPQNPTSSFEIANKDDVRTFEVKFTKDPKPPVKTGKRQPPKAF